TCSHATPACPARQVTALLAPPLVAWRWQPVEMGGIAAGPPQAEANAGARLAYGSAGAYPRWRSQVSGKLRRANQEAWRREPAAGDLARVPDENALAALHGRRHQRGQNRRD